MNVRRIVWVMMLFSAVSSCTSYTFLTDEDQQKIQTEHAKKSYFLKQSFFVGPFFAYEDRYYISERAFDERVMIENTSGEPILPPESTGILPMGTKVTIRQIEFPTGGAMASRKLKSPRFFSWVFLDLEGKTAEKPYILVLVPEFKRIDEFEQALSAYLTTSDPREEFASQPPEVLSTIDQKALFKGMMASALLRSRGYPDRITRKFENGVKIEHWQYTPARVVVLKEDRIDSWEGFPTP